MMPTATPKGILLVDKASGKTSFSLVAILRRRLHVRKVGHCGTLDPLASGLMVLLVGREYTRLADRFLMQDKEYIATIQCGVETNSYDAEGDVVATSDVIPTREALEEALTSFQGEVEQIPPMFSAKKVKGRKLYELARKGQVIERAPVKVTLDTELISYNYPNIELRIGCSKGTYVRSIAHDLGQMLGCCAHLTQLRRTRSGDFHVDQAITMEDLLSDDFALEEALVQHTAAITKGAA